MIRIRPERVTPVEVWDLPIDGQPLQEWRHDPTFPRRLARLVEAIRAELPARWSADARAEARTIAHVYLTGGGALTPGLAEAFAAYALPTTIAADPIFGAARAGLALLPRVPTTSSGTQATTSPTETGRSPPSVTALAEKARGAAEDRRAGESAVAAERQTTVTVPGACADVGQTALKFIRGEYAWSVDRDLARAPLRDTFATAHDTARESTLAFLASALTPLAGAPLVLALPCELTDAGVPLGCTYCWTPPDPDLLPDLARRAGLDLATLRVLNDAELAALSADRDPRLPRSGTTLVLTLGFGVGGALLGPAR